MSTILITSGAYVGVEFVAEFGKLPPAFLPIGNQRLFERQVRQIQSAHPSRILLSIPEDFEPDEFDTKSLTQLGVELIRVPEALRLGESIVYVLNVVSHDPGELRILHGDTLIDELSFEETDVVSVGESNEYYNWAKWDEDANAENSLNNGSFVVSSEARLNLSGYFSFSSSHLFVQSVTRSRGDFIGGLIVYNSIRRLKSLPTGSWMDFGHLQTYYQSRTRITTQRVFNDLHISKRVVTKSSSDVRKMRAEAAWFDQLPRRLKAFTPHLLGVSEADNQASYQLEYLHHIPLSDLYVFGRLPQEVWRAIFQALNEWISACSDYKPTNPTHEMAAMSRLYRDKTFERLVQFADVSGTSLDKEWIFNGQNVPSLRRIAEAALAAIPPAVECGVHVIHGDLCFSNILYDFRIQQVKLIDPRALNGFGEPTIYGDRRYDIAKLHHSVIGMYDYIIAERYNLDVYSNYNISFEIQHNIRVEEIQKEFISTIFHGLPIENSAASPISILFFLSMIPLHADNPRRQFAMLANSLRLYLEFYE